MTRKPRTTLQRLAGYEIVAWPVDIHDGANTDQATDATLQRAFDSLVAVRNGDGDLVGYIPYADAEMAIGFDAPVDVTWNERLHTTAPVMAR